MKKIKEIQQLKKLSDYSDHMIYTIANFTIIEKKISEIIKTLNLLSKALK